MGRPRRLLALLDSTRGAVLVLALAAAGSAALVLWVTDGATFVVDELYYYARLVPKDGALLHYEPFDKTYLLAPFYGHLALGIRVTYETVLGTIGANYTAFVLIDLAAIAATVAMVFVLIRRRLGNLAALAPCILLLFYGFAREQFVWPIDFNSATALATGLAAVLCLERGRPRADLLAFVLICISVAMIEVGVALAAGCAVLIALGGRGQWKRLWVVAVPAALYVAWWLWATPRFGHGETDLANLVEAPRVFFEGLSGVLGSLTGTNPVRPASQVNELTWFGGLLAVLALLAFALRLRRGDLPATIWAWLTALAVYWTLLAIGGRGPEMGRYLLVGAVLVILIGADCVRRPLNGLRTGLLFVLLALALPANVSQLVSDHDNDVFHHDARIEGVEFAMLELAGERVDPAYVPAGDPRVVEAGGGLLLGIPAGPYLQAASEHGSIAYSLERVRAQDEQLRRVADATLVGALALAPAPVTGARCAGGRAARSQRLPPVGTYLLGAGPAAIGLRRFATGGPGVELARLGRGEWVSLRTPRDGVAQPWLLVSDAPVRACSISSPPPASQEGKQP